LGTKISGGVTSDITMPTAVTRLSDIAFSLALAVSFLRMSPVPVTIMVFESGDGSCEKLF